VLDTSRIVQIHMIRIQVADEAGGIPEDLRSRIFTHGFTTKPKGHGFGLHSSALAARELGGRLSLASVPLDVPAGRLVARVWLARRVGIEDEARWRASRVMHNDAWVLFDRPDRYHVFADTPMPYPWATAVPGIGSVTDPAEALRLACLARPTASLTEAPGNRPPLDDQR